MDNEKHKWEMLASYFSRNITAEEKVDLEAWLDQTPDKEKKQYLAAKKLWENASKETKSYEPDTEKGWKQLQLKLSIRKRAPRRHPFIAVAATIIILFALRYLLVNESSKPEMIVVTAGSKVELLTLPDGSQVWLNQRAQLSYAKDYSANREVHLNGEAFFEVKKAEGKRFTIFTETTKTEVIGTSFNLRALPNEPVKVQVTTGKVAFSDLKKKDVVFLEPGQEAVYMPESNKVISKPTENPNYRAWQNKELIFKNTNLSDLCKTLEEYFQTKIVIPDHLKNCRFTVNFKDPGLEDVLNVLALTGNFNVASMDGGYTLTGKSCDKITN